MAGLLVNDLSEISNDVTIVLGVFTVVAANDAEGRRVQSRCPRAVVMCPSRNIPQRLVRNFLFFLIKRFSSRGKQVNVTTPSNSPSVQESKCSAQCCWISVDIHHLLISSKKDRLMNRVLVDLKGSRGKSTYGDYVQKKRCTDVFFVRLSC